MRNDTAVVFNWSGSSEKVYEIHKLSLYSRNKQGKEETNKEVNEKNNCLLQNILSDQMDFVMFVEHSVLVSAPFKGKDMLSSEDYAE